MWVYFKKQKIRSIGEDGKKLKPLYTIGRNANWCRYYEKHYGSFKKKKVKKKKEIELLYDPAIPHLGIYSK